MPWIKASERLPLHRAHWNTLKLGAHDNDFPVRMNGRYSMANIYDEAKIAASEPDYMLKFEGKEHHEEYFPDIEWLDESEECNQDELWIELFNAIKANIKYDLPAQDLANDFRKNYSITRK